MYDILHFVRINFKLIVNCTSNDRNLLKASKFRYCSTFICCQINVELFRKRSFKIQRIQLLKSILFSKL